MKAVGADDYKVSVMVPAEKNWKWPNILSKTEGAEEI